MKKFLSAISLLLSLTIFFVAFTACDSSSAASKETSASEKAEESINEGTEAKPDESEAVSGETSAASETETEATTEAEPPRPVANYDADFFLLIHNDSNRMEYHWVEESSNDVLSQAIYDRQQKVYNHLKVLADRYHICFTDDKEADYYQEQLDAQLRTGCDEFYPFYERYPQLKKFGYDKARKGWK
jgi:hypothetical protein